ncbi:MAG: hypothetical protein R3B06_20030 [Kofleriaceae bacterium]
MWNRRDLLRAAGVGAAATWLGCGSGRRPSAPHPAIELGGLRAALRAAVEVLGAGLAEPVAYAQVRRRIRAVVDLVERDVDDATAAVVVVAGRDRAGRWRERALDRTSPAAIRAAAQALVIGASAGPASTGDAPLARDGATAVTTDPGALGTADWHDVVDDLARRAAAGANSRIVYRGVYVVTDVDQVWAVSSTSDTYQRLIRSRLGATAVAWHGSRPVAGTAEIAGGFGPEPARLTDAALAAMNADALALTTPGGFAPLADAAVGMAPSVAAALVGQAWAAGVGGGPLAVADVPDLTVGDHAGFASYFFDALGQPARGGQPRRSGPLARLSTAPSNLVVAVGAVADLEAAVGDGVIVSGVVDVGCDGDQLAVRTSRAYRIAGGKRTGHAWRDVEVRGRLGPLLAGITAIGDRAEAVAGPDDDRPPSAIVTPAVATRARLTTARGEA